MLLLLRMMMNELLKIVALFAYLLQSRMNDGAPASLTFLNGTDDDSLPVFRLYLYENGGILHRWSQTGADDAQRWQIWNKVYDERKKKNTDKLSP